MYNPVLCICLANELLKNVGNTINMFKQQCDELVNDLCDMGNALVSGMDRNVIEACYMDVDFFDRTTFKHITDYGYSALLED
jgi:hypothetical protein